MRAILAQIFLLALCNAHSNKPVGICPAALLHEEEHALAGAFAITEANSTLSPSVCADSSAVFGFLYNTSVTIVVSEDKATVSVTPDICANVAWVLSSDGRQLSKPCGPALITIETTASNSSHDDHDDDDHDHDHDHEDDDHAHEDKILLVTVAEQSNLTNYCQFSLLGAHEEHDDESDESYNLDLQIGGIFIIIGVGLSGALSPVIADRCGFRQSTVVQNVLLVGRMWGIGVIIATGFIHMLLPALQLLSSPCLPVLWSEEYTGFAGVFAILAIFAMQQLQYQVTSFFAGKSGHGHGHTGKTDESPTTTPNSLEQKLPLSRVNSSSSGDGKLTTDSPSHSHSHSHSHAHSHSHSPSHKHDGETPTSSEVPFNQLQPGWSHALDPKTGNLFYYNRALGITQWRPPLLADVESQKPLVEGSVITAQEHAVLGHGGHGGAECHPVDHHGHSHSPLLMSEGDAKTAVLYMLELGVATHSIIIGIAVGVTTGSEFTTLLIAIAFHQFFEGFAFGTAVVQSSLKRARTAWLLALMYGFATPVGQLIGILIHSSYNENSREALLVQGIFDACCAGILIYTGLVELLNPDVTQSVQFRKLSLRMRLACFCSLYLGCGLMALLGRWA